MKASSDAASTLFALEAAGPLYTRVSNPTQDAFERRLAELEGGAAALARSSAYAILNVARAGDNIVSAAGLYGGTWTLFAATLKSFDIETRFVDASDPEAFETATDERTRAYYAESLPNPKREVFPVAEVAAISRAIVDSGTFPWVEHAERQPNLNEPDPSYQDKTWIEKAATIAFHPYIPRRPAARSWRGDQPAERLPVHPGPGDVAAAPAPEQ
ncbi:PLP-dependent transferase [Shinella sp.]|uniref:PLP-dependent transferase n=1 Tax=Shinella sp. TaxID=1870904 RepID=UPI003F6EFEB1